MTNTSLKLFLALAALAALFAGAFFAVGAVWLLERSPAQAGASAESSGSGSAMDSWRSCNVLDLQIYGEIVETRSEVPVSDTLLSNDGSNTLLTPNYTVASDIEYYLDTASSSYSNIKALLIDVDSQGGDSESGFELADAIRGSGKPSAAVIHTLGASSAYLAASAADRVFAAPASTVGSIGATLSYLDQYQKDQKEGVVYEQLSSGPYKDMFNPDKPLTDAERALAERDLTILKDQFVDRVALYRHQSTSTIDALADGSTVLGQQALDDGLIDGLGGRQQALDYLADQIGEPVSVCWE